MRTLFDQSNDTYAKFYSPSENLAVDEVIMLFKDRVIFRQYIPKKHKHFSTKIYKLCSTTVYMGKDRQNATQMMRATHVTVRSLTHKLFMENSKIYLMTCTQEVSTVVIVKQNHKGMPRGLDKKTLK
jgi:hypothetical protein